MTERLRKGQRLRVPGHKLTLTWSGETGIESSSTGECSCGWMESGSNRYQCRHEYRHHLLTVIAQQQGRDRWEVEKEWLGLA